MSDYPKVGVSLTADIMHPHLVSLTAWSGMMESERYALTPEQALSLASSLVTHARQALVTQKEDALRGDCETCSNIRMVTVDGPGSHPMREQCPDCFPKRNTPVPTHSAAAQIEREAYGQ